MRDPDARDRERDAEREAVYGDREPQDAERYQNLISEPPKAREPGERLL